MSFRSFWYGVAGFVLLIIFADTIVFPWIMRRAIGEARATLAQVYKPGIDPATIPSMYIAEVARAKLKQQLTEHGQVREFRIARSYAQISGLPAVLELDVRRGGPFTEVLYFHGSQCTSIEVRKP